MQNRQSRALESLHNARAFLDANAEALPTVASSGMRQKLERTIDELTTHADAQGHHELVALGTTRQARNRRTSLLRDHMALIAGVAKVELKGTPEIEPLRMQKTRIRTADLFRAATAMADAAEPFSSVFIGAGLPQDFIAQLLAAADAMMASVREREQSIGKRTGATTGISAQLQLGRTTIGALDRFVTSALNDNPALLTNWKTLRRVRFVKDTPAVSAASAPSTTTPPPRTEAAA